jgi:hypothetical protein
MTRAPQGRAAAAFAHPDGERVLVRHCQALSGIDHNSEGREMIVL